MSELIRRSYKHKLKEHSQKNRKNPTLAEGMFRDHILKNNKTGYRFLRQKPLDNFIMDFYCPKLKLCIEIDGWYHLDKDQKDYDEIRENILNTYDIKIIRYSNNEVFARLDRIKNNLNGHISCRVQQLIAREDSRYNNHLKTQTQISIITIDLYNNKLYYECNYYRYTIWD